MLPEGFFWSLAPQECGGIGTKPSLTFIVTLIFIWQIAQRRGRSTWRSGLSLL